MTRPKSVVWRETFPAIELHIGAKNLGFRIRLRDINSVIGNRREFIVSSASGTIHHA